MSDAQDLGLREILGIREVRASMVGTFIIMVGFGIVSPILPLYARTFGVGLDAVGVLIAAFSLARLITDPFTGVIIERLGERRTITLGSVVVGATSILAGLAPTYWLLVVTRGLGGAGSAIFFAGILSYMLRVIPSDRLGRVMSMWYASFNVGIIAGEPIGGVLASWLGPRSTLWVYALACFGAAIWFARTISPPPPSEAKTERRTGIRHLPWNRQFVTVLLANGAYAWMIAGVYSYLIPLFGNEEVGLTALGLGVGLALAAVTEFAILFPAGRATDRLGRKAVLVPSYALLALALVLWPLATTPALFFLANALFGLVTGYSGVPQAPMLADVTTDEQRRSAVAVFRFVGDLGFVIGPLVAGVTADRMGYGPAFALAAVPVLVALGFALSIRETLSQLPRTGEAAGL